MDFLIIVETNLADKALHAGVDGRDVTVDGGIIGDFTVTEVNEVCHNEINTCQ